MRMNFNRIRSLGIWLAAAACLGPGLPAQTALPSDSRWVSVTETVSLGRTLTYDQAERIALDRARARAVREGAPTEIIRNFLSINRRAADEVQREFSRGFIVGEEAPTVARGDSLAEGPSVTVTARFQVAQPPGDPDPGFDLEVELNHRTFRPGDEVVFSARASRPARLFLFNVTADNRVTQLLPGPAGVPADVRPETPFEFPSAEDRRVGRRIIAALSDDGKATTERLWLLAFREGVTTESWLRGANVQGAFGSVPDASAAPSDLWRALMRFNLRDWTMREIVIEIRP